MAYWQSTKGGSAIFIAPEVELVELAALEVRVEVGEEEVRETAEEVPEVVLTCPTAGDTSMATATAANASCTIV